MSYTPVGAVMLVSSSKYPRRSLTFLSKSTSSHENTSSDQIAVMQGFLAHVTSPSPLKGLLVFACSIWVLAAYYLRQTSSDDPSSAFFRPESAFTPRYSAARQRQAEIFVDNATTATHAPTTEPRLCVGIASVQREEQYLKIAIGSLLEGLTEKERNEIHLTTLIANSNATDHLAFRERWLHDLADRVLTYENVPKEKQEEIERLEREDSEHRVKALLDYTHLLENCAATGAAFVLMLEDDVVAAECWYARTKAALRELEEHRDFDKSLYVRLFYTSHLFGWNSEEWKSYLVLSIAVAAAVAAVLYALHRYHKPSARILTVRTVVAVVCIYVPACILLYFAAGRLTVAPLAKGLQPMESYGCCSQALVYPQHQIPGLVKFYCERGIGFVDVLTEEYASAEHMRRWALVPSAFQHVGARSSKSSDDQDSKWHRSVAANIWNFDFERFDEADLRKAHLAATADRNI